ncbi:T9SS type A sorting domain-containing protein [Crocinitomicaceae bacterium]|nr:T9SS type A sorting domain-containing protein [Crocinitomicaceae bacterium]
MKQNYLKAAAIALGLFSSNQLAAQVTTTFDYTGDVQTYTVPIGVTSIQIECWGAQGQATTIDDYAPFSNGGLGGYAVGVLAVTPGEVLNIYVGGEGLAGVGGYNGGAIGGLGSPGSGGTEGYGGSGGGASDVRQGGTDLTDRAIVAGGGGGGGRNYTNGSCVPCGTGGNGGEGGGTVGGSGDDPADAIYDVYFNVGAGADGGTDAAGGSGGMGEEGTNGNDGELGIGGVGIGATQGAGSGGGGGGYYGGGSGAGPSAGSGAAGGGGGGGSSYLGGVTDGETLPGEREGDGLIVITELCNPMTVTVSDDEICFGDEVTISATAESGDAVTWDMAVEDGIAFVPEMVGENTYVGSSGNVEDCDAVVTIWVNELPEVFGSSTPDDGGTGVGAIDILVTGGAPAYVFDWNNDGTGDFDDTEDLTGLTTGAYVVVVQDANSCESQPESFFVSDLASLSSDEHSTISVYPNPTVDQLTIVNEGVFTYQLISISGDVVLNGNATDQEILSLSEMANGIYFLQVNVDSTVQTIKVVKQ